MVQEKDITFPTDIKLLRRSQKGSKDQGLKIRQNHKYIVSKMRQIQGFKSHLKNKSRAIRVERKLKTITGRLLLGVGRQLEGLDMLVYQSFIDVSKKVLAQHKTGSNKIYSLHEPHVYCMSKGKDRKRYEYGSRSNSL